MTIAKLLLYTYVAIEGVFGVGVSIWACMLLADPNQQAAFSLGVLGAGLLMLFCALTFYKGMTDTPCLLNLSFLASLLKNPTPDEFRAYVRKGEQTSWPHIGRIRMACMVEFALDDCVQTLRRQLVAPVGIRWTWCPPTILLAGL